MFKTIDECRLDLVSYTVGNVTPKEITMLKDETAASREYLDCQESNMDFMPCSAARVSFGNEDRTGLDQDKDRKLMKYLADNKHTSCFEHQTATFLVEVPLFIRSQIHRHRTFSYNEISRRYTSEELEFWYPDEFRGQSSSNRQASDGTPEGQDQDWLNVQYTGMTASALRAYNELIELGVAREQARAVLPQSLLTKFFMTGNLRNWQHFIELRTEEHSQKEVQVVANRIAEKLRELWPNSCEALGI